MLYSNLCNTVYYNSGHYEWAYYSDSNQEFNYSWQECARDIIISIFENGKKGKIIKCIEGLSDERCKHMLSAYFLGHYISDRCCFLTEIKRKWGHDFSWYWYLSCLFHDIDFDKEDAKNPKNKRQYFLKHIFDERNATENLLYPSSLIEKYRRFRITQGRYDHGIYGGLRLWREIPKHRNSTQLGNLIFNEDYKQIAKIIACHNIYLCLGRDNLKPYQDFDLYELIPNNEYNCKMPRSLGCFEKLYFLLCLCDSIEPTKRGIDLGVLNIDVNNNSIEIKLPDNNITYYNYVKTQFELNAWLNYIKVSVIKNDNEYIIRYEINRNE